MNVSDLLNIEDLIFFKKDNETYVYLSRKAKRKNEDLKAFHNVVKIKKTEIIIIKDSNKRKEILDYFTNTLGYKKD